LDAEQLGRRQFGAEGSQTTLFGVTHDTSTAHHALPSLRSPRFVREAEQSFRYACERGRFRPAHYSIQADHAHMIVEAATARDLASGMKSIGSRLARAMNRVFGRRGRVLADRYHAQILRTPCEVRNAIAYVLLNARRHLAKLGKRPSQRGAIDPSSSGRWFDGWNRPTRSTGFSCGTAASSCASGGGGGG
jgi:hypothetical protein